MLKILLLLLILIPLLLMAEEPQPDIEIKEYSQTDYNLVFKGKTYIPRSDAITGAIGLAFLAFMGGLYLGSKLH